MDTVDYIEHCELLLNDREFYEKLDANATLIYNEEVKQKIDDMLRNNYITKQEYSYLDETLEKPRASLFYELPKIQKYLIHFHHYDLLSLALILAHAICHSLLILS